VTLCIEEKLMKAMILSGVGLLLVASMATAEGIKIVYSSAGLTKVEVTEQKQLQFVWHTGRLPFEEGDSSPMQQSLAAYDSHSATIWLTKAEMETFRQWIDQNGILDLKTEYPEPEQKTYGSAFHSSLSVELDGKKKSLAWTGDTKVPDPLLTAINKLVQMCQEIRKSREGR
jgi:hypothetical protein